MSRLVMVTSKSEVDFRGTSATPVSENKRMALKKQNVKEFESDIRKTFSHHFKAYNYKLT